MLLFLGLPPPDCWELEKMVRFASKTMKSLHFRAFLAILWLVFTLSAGAQSTPAQTPATPPAPSPPAPRPLQAPRRGCNSQRWRRPRCRPGLELDLAVVY